MKLLVTGARGQVGSEVVCLAPRKNLSIIACGRDSLDIARPDAVRSAIARIAPDAVVNAAAYTAVDRAETDPASAYRVNRDGVIHLATVCAEQQIPLLHISTDYVFAGTSTVPYRETDTPAPCGVYGQSKLEGEEAVRRLMPRHIILRVGWIFGSHGSNFVKTIVHLAREQAELRIVADQWGCPTAAQDIARVLIDLAMRATADPSIRWGTYHYCGTPSTTWYDFAQIIVAEARPCTAIATRHVRPISTDEYPMPARRPANSTLDCSQIHREFGIEPAPWRPALKTVVKEVCHA